MCVWVGVCGAGGGAPPETQRERERERDREKTERQRDEPELDVSREIGATLSPALCSISNARKDGFGVP